MRRKIPLMARTPVQEFWIGDRKETWSEFFVRMLRDWGSLIAIFISIIALATR